MVTQALTALAGLLVTYVQMVALARTDGNAGTYTQMVAIAHILMVAQARTDGGTLALTDGGTHLLRLPDYTGGVVEVGGGPQSGKSSSVNATCCTVRTLSGGPCTDVA